MAVNISARNYQLIIGGLNCTPALKSVDGGYGHYDSTGLILISASLVLGRALDFNENLDDRSNPRWARGNIINLYIANSSGQLVAAPIIGYLYILKAEFDGISQLKIEAGCILNLLNFRTPAGDGACFDLGESVDLNTIAVKLLNKAGAGGRWAGSLSGAPLLVPLPKLSNESYIQLFGKLCWVNGFVAYQDNNGFIKAKKVDRFPYAIKSLQVGVDDVRYERLSGAESPVELIKVSGVLSSNKKTPDFTRQVNENYEIVTIVGLNSVTNESRLIGKTITEEKLDFNFRNKIRTEDVYGSITTIFSGFINAPTSQVKLVFSEKRIEKDTYERSAPPQADNCQNPDEGRLIEKSIKSYKPLKDALADYFDARPNLQVTNGDRLVLASQITTSYRYDNRQFAISGGAIQQGGDQIENAGNPSIITEEMIIYGVMRPEASINIAKALELKLNKKNTTYWRQIRKGEWEVEESFYELRESVEPTGLTNNYKSSENLYLQKRDVRRSNSGQTTPPAPERFPATHQIMEKQIKKEVRLPALSGNPFFRPREKEIVIDGGLLTSEQQAYELGLIEGHILWGRHKGQSCGVALSDEWFSAAPLSGCWWKDLSGLSHLFMVDGLSIAFVNNRLALAFDGIWCGSAPANIPQSQQYDNLVPPYLRVFDVELGSISILESEAYPYSIEPSFGFINLFSQSGFSVLTGADIRNVEFGSNSGFGVLTGADIRNIELGSVSGFSSTSPINILLGSASGIFVLVAEGVQLGSISQFGVSVDSFEARVDIGSVSGFEIEVVATIDIELGSNSQFRFVVDEIEFSVEFGSVSGFNVEVAPDVNVELGSVSQFEILIDGFDSVVELGSSSGYDVEVAPEINVELGSNSQLNSEFDEFEFRIDLGAILGFDVEQAEEFNVELGAFSQFSLDIDSWELHVNLGSSSGLFVEQAPRVDVEPGSISQFNTALDSFDSRVDLGSASGFDTEMYDSRLVTHNDDALVTGSSGARWVAYMPDMKHLALEPEAIIYRSNIILNGGSIAHSDLIGINAFIQEMKIANLWDKCLEIYPFVGNDLLSARVKLKSAISQHSLGISGLINFDKYYGVLSGGGFLLTGINPRNQLIEDNLHLSVFIQPINSQSTSGGWLLGSFNSLSQALGIQRNPGLARLYSGGNRNTNLRNINRNDLFIASRIPGTSLFKYSEFISVVNASTTMLLPDFDLTLLARNNNGSYDSISPDTIAFSSIGYGFSLEEISQYEYIVRNLLYSLGRIL